MELFEAAKVAEFHSASERRCRFCNQHLELVRTIVDTASGELIHMFECECGERVWDD
ncbi:hypothetical protein ACFFWD_42400 [Bradyrhizobium erythrophlei]|uniref:hypothetical protein n=1 Tax=Bradyrhizobium erythrophlei TaxID=1437360 RepID=UPI0035F0A40C